MSALPKSLARAPRRSAFQRTSAPAFVALALVVFATAPAYGNSTYAAPPSPDLIYGDFFARVQRTHVFADQKTFCDAVPLHAPAAILARYRAESRQPSFALGAFVHDNFALPAERTISVPPEPSVEAHVAALWPLLQRSPDRAVPGSSLLPLPHPYIVPGGRFREVYYWDSYFTMLGLRASGRSDLMRDMVENFAYELGTYGLIPNGNRTYYLSRSQPPFFALMVELLAAPASSAPAPGGLTAPPAASAALGVDAARPVPAGAGTTPPAVATSPNGDALFAHFRPALEREYAYWTDRSFPTEHVVSVPGGTLARYWDRRDTPRPEAFALDEATAADRGGSPVGIYRDLRSAAESGWDFSSRWCADPQRLSTIETTRVAPVDLNALLYQLERTLAHARRATGDVAGATAADGAAERRAATLRALCWSEADGYFFDYDVRTHQRRTAWTLAGVMPLFVGLATPAQADRVADAIRARFLRPGGVVTTLVATGQQWDAPNGWAPLQWITIAGLRRYGHDRLADEISRRWLALNRAVYARTGKMMEKYNVEDLSLAAGGGEYPSQDGFGWTNGVFLALADQETTKHTKYTKP